MALMEQEQTRQNGERWVGGRLVGYEQFRGYSDTQQRYTQLSQQQQTQAQPQQQMPLQPVPHQEQQQTQPFAQQGYSQPRRPTVEAKGNLESYGIPGTGFWKVPITSLDI